VPLVQVLAVVGIFEAVRTQGLAFWAMGRADIIMYWALGALIVMLGAFGLGLRGGILGVAWSYAVVGPVLQTIAHVLVGRFLRLPLWEMVQAVAPPALSAGVMAVVVFALVRFGVAAHLPVGGRLAFLVAAGAVLYTGLMALLGWRAGQHLRGAFEWVTGQGLGVRGAGEVL
jgi:hypothetical protein